jgi:hypothetical protein
MVAQVGSKSAFEPADENKPDSTALLQEDRSSSPMLSTPANTARPSSEYKTYKNLIKTPKKFKQF